MVSQSYQSVEAMIELLCHRYENTFHLDPDDCLSEANMAFVMAEETFQLGKGATFPTYVYNCVRNALQLLARREHNRRKRFTQLPRQLDENKLRIGHLGKFVSILSDDAASIAEIIMDESSEIRQSFGRKRNPGKLRLIRSYLWAQNWTMERITNAFSELREVTA